MAKIEIYTKGYCPYCTRAKQLLKQKGVRFEEFDVQHNQARWLEMSHRSGRRTVPQVFINGTHVGGSDDLMLANKNGMLDRILGKEERRAV